MLRLLLPLLGALAACAPSPQDAAMRSNSPVSETDTRNASNVDESAAPDYQPPVTLKRSGNGGPNPELAAQAPIPEAVSAAENRLLAGPVDAPTAAQGRRTLSAAFVMVGPDGHLTIELRDGRMLVLRDVTMRPHDFCGVAARGGTPKGRYCGGYADVIAARPGGGQIVDEPPSATSNPIGKGRGTTNFQ